MEQLQIVIAATSIWFYFKENSPLVASYIHTSHVYYRTEHCQFWDTHAVSFPFVFLVGLLHNHMYDIYYVRVAYIGLYGICFSFLGCLVDTCTIGNYTTSHYFYLGTVCMFPFLYKGSKLVIMYAYAHAYRLSSVHE